MKLLKISGIISFLIIVLYLIWLSLPVKYNRYSDIKTGNRIIEKISIFYEENSKLPENYNWKLFKKLDFDTTEYFLKPEYSKINDSTYELIFVEDFDPPHLLWNSNEKKWKNDFPSLPEKSNHE
jgi:hypothetical protein